MRVEPASTLRGSVRTRSVIASVIRDYLGHASVATTSRYITSNLQMKRNVLDAFWKRAGLSTARTRPWRPSRKVLEVLQSV
jgi:integrase